MIERRDNRWTGGKVNLDLGVLSPEDRGRTGARFMDVVFEEGKPVETLLHILEESPYAQQYGCLNALDLFTTTLLVNTDFGPVAMIIWRLADRGATLVHYEHHLDPLSSGLSAMLDRVESQTRLKVVMRDNQTGETTGFWDFPNNFNMGEFREIIAQVAPKRPVSPMPKRISWLYAKYRFEDLIALANKMEGTQ
jgi:hypothetical protein